MEHRSFWSFIAVALGVVAIVVASIAIVVSNNSAGGSSGGGAAVPSVNVTLTEFAITPADITVPPGKVNFVITNSGTLEHNFEIKGVAQTNNLKPGESQTLSVSLDAGHYDTLCTVAGHEGSGMKGMVMAVEGAHRRRRRGWPAAQPRRCPRTRWTTPCRRWSTRSCR